MSADVLVRAVDRGAAQELTALLARVPGAHRRVVALELGMGGADSPAEIAAVLRARARIAAVVGGLSAGARRLVAEAALTGETVIYESWGGRPSPAALELERHGLAFAFKHSYILRYAIPRALHPRLADAVAAPYAADLATARPARFVDAPLQLAHDVAALWAHLARRPVRVKTTGAVYQRDAPKLFSALPPVEFHDPERRIAADRLGFALAVLTNERLVRIRVDDRPGRDGRQELVANGDPSALLEARADVLRQRLLCHACAAPLGVPALALVNALKPGATVKLSSFGAAMRALYRDSGIALPQAPDAGLALAGLQFAWLSGAVSLGADRDGIARAVRAEPAADGARATAGTDGARGRGHPQRESGRVICQGNFELIALSPPTPAERLTLALTCENASGQAHVFRLTRQSVQAAQRTGALSGGVLAALERLVGELPQNVARTVAGWTASVRRPLRLRTAMTLDAGDAQTADALLAGDLGRYVVERIGPSQLAVRVDDVRAVETALRRAGHELEPGVDRVSGRFADRDNVPTDAQRVWDADTQDSLPAGKQVSMLDSVAEQRSLREAVDSSADAVQTVRDAIARGDDVLITYTGARGTTQRQITPYEADADAVHGYCHLRGEERSFWLASIQDAIPVERRVPDVARPHLRVVGG